MTWQPVPGGRSGDAVTRRGDVFRKQTARAALEAATMSWLRDQGFPAAEVLEVAGDVLLTRALPGRPASSGWPADELPRMVDAVADLSNALHALPTADCPFDRSLAVTAPIARYRARAGEVDLQDLDDERAGWSTERLTAALDTALPAAVEREQLSVTHGDFCLPNVMIDPDSFTVSGIVDTAFVGRADRHTDLALMHRSLGSTRLNPQFGPQLAQRFLRRCGLDPDHEATQESLAFYRLLDEFN